jgi:primosomal protein N' (replication factor Y)
LRAEAPAATHPQAFLEAARHALAALGATQVRILGPAPAPMERRAGRYRAHLLLQCAERGPLQRLLADALPRLDTLKEARRVRWSIDVDPASLD